MNGTNCIPQLRSNKNSLKILYIQFQNILGVRYAAVIPRNENLNSVVVK